MTDIASHIATFNAGRDLERLSLKYKLMRAGPFAFLRGTCHLFYERLPGADVLRKSPLAWISGDLHFENFGSYKGDNRLVYFDINDFDEACLAPCTWELVRFLTSVLVGTASLGVSRAEAMALCYTALEAYTATLRTGKARWIERDTAEGMVGELLDQLKGRARVDLLDRRTELKGRKRILRLDGKKALPVTGKQREKVAAFMAEFARTQDNPGFYRMLDVARRIAGTGSLGLDRYVILIEGKGSPNGNYLLDLKEAAPSAVARHLHNQQPGWESEAQRVVEVEWWSQAVPAAFLRAVMLEGRPYILRALQPVDDRVALAGWNGKLPRLELVMKNMAELTAWAQLRSGGRQGSAVIDELIAFGSQKKWPGALIEIAQQCASQADEDWRTYCTAYDDGVFTAGTKSKGDGKD
ncbi:DUF2252 domain-containing protein [Cupriavidus campinensis]